MSNCRVTLFLRGLPRARPRTEQDGEAAVSLLCRKLPHGFFPLFPRWKVRDHSISVCLQSAFYAVRKGKRDKRLFFSRFFRNIFCHVNKAVEETENIVIVAFIFLFGHDGNADAVFECLHAHIESFDDFSASHIHRDGIDRAHERGKYLSSCRRNETVEKSRFFVFRMHYIAVHIFFGFGVKDHVVSRPDGDILDRIKLPAYRPVYACVVTDEYAGAFRFFTFRHEFYMR